MTLAWVVVPFVFIVLIALARRARRRRGALRPGVVGELDLLRNQEKRAVVDVVKTTEDSPRNKPPGP